MKNARQASLGVMMALIFCTMIIGSASLSMMESGYALAQAPSLAVTELTFSGERVIIMANAVVDRGTSTPALGLQVVTPTYALPTNCPKPQGWVEISVQADDTLRSLAKSYSTSVDALKSANCLLTGALAPGSTLYVPALPPKPATPQCGAPNGWVSYTVRPGDTLAYLSSVLRVSLAQLQTANCLGTSTYVWVGQRLSLPSYPPVYATAYPTATRWLSATPWPPTATYPPTPTRSSTLPPTITVPPTWTLPPDPTATEPGPTPTPGGATETLPPATATSEPPTVPPPPTDTPVPPATATSEPPTVPPPPTWPPPTVPPPPTIEPPTPTAFPYP